MTKVNLFLNFQLLLDSEALITPLWDLWLTKLSREILKIKNLEKAKVRKLKKNRDKKLSKKFELSAFVLFLERSTFKNFQILVRVKEI
jgi:hypothetical protein